MLEKPELGPWGSASFPLFLLSLQVMSSKPRLWIASMDTGFPTVSIHLWPPPSTPDSYNQKPNLAFPLGYLKIPQRARKGSLHFPFKATFLLALSILGNGFTTYSVSSVKNLMIISVLSFLHSHPLSNSSANPISSAFKYCLTIHFSLGAHCFRLLLRHCHFWSRAIASQLVSGLLWPPYNSFSSMRPRGCQTDGLPGGSPWPPNPMYPPSPSPRSHSRWHFQYFWLHWSLPYITHFLLIQVLIGDTS